MHPPNSGVSANLDNLGLFLIFRLESAYSLIYRSFLISYLAVITAPRHRRLYTSQERLEANNWRIMI